MQIIINSGISLISCLLLVYVAPLGDLYIYFNSDTVSAGFLYGVDFQNLVKKLSDFLETWDEQKFFYGVLSGFTLFMLLSRYPDLLTRLAVTTVFFASLQFGNIGALIIALLYLARDKPILFFTFCAVVSFIKPFYFIILVLYCIDKNNRREFLFHFIILSLAFLYYWSSKYGVMSNISSRSDFGFNHIGILQYLANEYIHVVIVVFIGSSLSFILLYSKFSNIFVLFFLTTPRLKEYDVFVGILDLFRTDKKIRGWISVLLFNFSCISAYASPKINLILGFCVLIIVILPERKKIGYQG